MQKKNYTDADDIALLPIINNNRGSAKKKKKKKKEEEEERHVKSCEKSQGSPTYPHDAYARQQYSRFPSLKSRIGRGSLLPLRRTLMESEPK